MHTLTLDLRAVQWPKQQQQEAASTCTESAILACGLWYTAAELLGARLYQEGRLLLQQMQWCSQQVAACREGEDGGRSSFCEASDTGTREQRLVAKYSGFEDRLRQVRSIVKLGTIAKLRTIRCSQRYN